MVRVGLNGINTEVPWCVTTHPTKLKMNKNLVRIDIRDNESLLEACDILHDARCDISTLQVDENAGTWKARFEREFFEDPALMKYEPKLFVFNKATFLLADSELTLTGVKSYKIEDKSKIGIYTFSEVKIADGLATFFFCEAMEMVLTFQDTPQGSLVDHKLLDKEGSFHFFRNPFQRGR